MSCLHSACIEIDRDNCVWVIKKNYQTRDQVGIHVCAGISGIFTDVYSYVLTCFGYVNMVPFVK